MDSRGKVATTRVWGIAGGAQEGQACTAHRAHTYSAHSCGSPTCSKVWHMAYAHSILTELLGGNTETIWRLVGICYRFGVFSQCPKGRKKRKEIKYSQGNRHH